ncbi:5,6-dimethylbenzimidazole synthase [Methyloligella solikamskensis]|uniref:5,6-dimethylbenzimidazole synthase n=1 Tax=Methyloligella solikamskensis TaxID=1177756 RepID=A0ABW3J8X4_9HYPH
MEPPESAKPPDFDSAFREQLLDLLTWRRDVRHFKRDPLSEGAVERLIGIACLSPSVGLSEPWRFVLVEDEDRRAAIRACFEACNAEALSAQEPSRADRYARLKLAGLNDAPCQIAVFADHETEQGHGLGRQTMPETIEYSVAIAIHTLWLAARADGFGLGWVSILDPADVRAALDVSEHWRFVGYLCLGYPEEATETPLLERQGWETRRAPDKVIFRR